MKDHSINGRKLNKHDANVNSRILSILKMFVNKSCSVLQPLSFSSVRGEHIGLLFKQSF